MPASRPHALILLAFLSATAWRAGAQSAADRATVAARSAPDSVVGFDGRRTDAERTTLTVRHRLAAPGDTVTFDVAYLRLPARTSAPRAPIVFLMGGPGVPASAMAQVPPYYQLFDRLREHADVILLDQRGVGLSGPRPDCPAAAPPEPDFLVSLARLAAALEAVYTLCVAHWRARGVPAELLTVSQVAHDVEDIRRQLGVPRVALLGFSYGTRLALEYAARYPDRVDLVVLQGVLGFEHVIRLPTTLDSILGRVAAVAARDSLARALTGGDLAAALAVRFAALDREPLRVPVARASGDSAVITVGREGLQAIVQGRLNDPRLPALVGSLGAGDTRVLAALIGTLYRDLAQGGGSLYGRAVYCSAPASAEREELARRLTPGSLLGPVFDNVPESPEFCSAIGITPGPRPAPARRLAAAPALLITGTLDDRTPLPNAADARGFFGTATLLTVENGGHELIPNEDVQSLVVEFFATGRVARDRLVLPAPSYMTVDQVLQPPRRR